MKGRMNKFFSILLVICMILSMVPAVVFAATPDVLYLKPNSEWLADGARFAAYFFGNGDTWVDLTDSDGDGYYEASVPSGYTSVIFCRMNPGTSDNNWDNKWNQSGDLSIPTDGKNCWTLNSGDWNGGGAWSTYTVQEPETTQPAAVDFYLVGYINGANHGCEEDYQNMGNYKFVNGSLTATFTADSYVFVKTTNNGAWYMAQSYAAEPPVNMAQGGTEKLFVPGNVEVTFTLKVNDNGSLALDYTVATVECSHSYTSKVTTAPTCTTEGKETWTCSKCGNQYYVILGATGHSYTSKVTTAATCTKTGVKTYTCSDCGDSYTETIVATGHNYSNSVCTVCGAKDPNCSHSYTSSVTVAPTCVNTGVKTYTCSKCGDVYTETIAATGHSYIDIVVPPTCENNGYTRHQCENCGEYGLNTDPVNPTGHDYSTVVTPPTCTEKGYTTYTCANCGNVYTWNETAATGHSYVGGICTTCGVEDPDYVKEFYLFGFINGANYGCEEDYANMGSYKFANGKLTVTFDTDSYVAVKITNNDAWYMAQSYTTEKTVTLYNTASNSVSEKLFVPGNVKVTFTLKENSNDTLTLSYTIDPSSCAHADHDTDGNCLVCGTSVGHDYVYGTCTTCGASDSSYIPDYYLFGFINGVNYGCEEDSENMGIYKFVDGKLTVTFDTDSYVGIKTSGNVDWYMTNYFVDSNEGTFYSTSTGANEKMLIPGGVKTVLTLTVNSDGSLTLSYCKHAYHNTSGKCTTCGETVDHSYTSKTTAPTCTAEGYTTHTCSVCGKSYTDSTVAATGHSYDAVVTAPTCTADGYTTYTCSTCGDSYTSNKVAATGHNYEYGTCTTCGATDSSYTPDYYLFGFINGVNYGCEDDYTNMGSYKFTDGKLTVTFDIDSYVGIKTSGNKDWYMTNTYVDGNEATLYNTSTGANEKMRIPGGAKVTLTLKVNADGTLKLSYSVDAANCEHRSHDDDGVCTTCGTAVGHSWNNGTCSGCGKECSHNYQSAVTTKPTCTAEGKETWTCTICSNVYYVILGATGHSYTSKVTTAATCTKTGVRTYTCSACGDSYTETIVATGHNYVNSVCTVCGAKDPNCSHSYTSEVTIAPTCVDTGVKTYTCSKCGDVYTEEIAATGHSYIDIVVPPTCENNGYTEHRCENCGIYSNNTDPVNPTGHNYSSVVTPPTCTTEGYTTYTCANCGNVYTWNKTPATGHSYSAGKCTTCGDVDADYEEQYYLVGFINGANYGCEEDAANLGEYKFVDGTLVVTFTQDSYVFIKNGDNTVWYMSQAYDEDNYATLYPTTMNVSEKMFVPGNIEVTFTLTVQWDGSLALSYVTECMHESHSTDGICSNCGRTVSHNYAMGACTICGLACEHNYVGGVCQQCGDALPVDYYLFGYINGANYACEEDYENIGIYKFVDNTLTVTFTQDSYVGVKKGDNSVFYMCDGFSQESTSRRMYDASTLGNPDKLYVPGGKEVVFSLYVHNDNSVTLSYVLTEEICEHPDHNTDGVCTECGATIGHNYNSDLVCTVCGKTCTHNFANGVCVDCGTVCAHSKHSVEGYCTTCGVTVEHTYLSGVCTVCRASDPSYVEEEWYLFGYINGTDYGQYDDAASTGYFRLYPTGDPNSFGKTFTVTEDSYIAVKNGSNTRWFMTDGWQGEVTSVTLYDTTTLGENADKLYIPAGKVTVTLVVNGDGTLTLSYTVQQTDVCEHPSHDQNGYCTVCHYSVEHTYVNGTCSVCGKTESGSTGCSHSYVGVETTPAGCLTDGVMTYTCSACGDSYTETIPYTGHNFNYGTCTKCGEADPNYEPPVTDYYLFGYINGANYGCEEDYETMGIYKFVDGKLTVTFDIDSYVGIKTEGNASWYMTNEYVSASTGTFYNTSTGSGEKMFVPGGVEVTFTLVVNDDDTLTLSYTKAACDHSYTSKVTTAAGCETAGVKTYTCSKCGDSYTESIAATGHSYTSKVTAPSCTTEGYTTHTCSNCGDSYTDSKVAATGHSYTSKVTTAAGCTTAGVKTYTCSKCGHSYTESIAATGHSYTSKVTTAATCTKTGVKTYTCSNCSHSYTEAIAATGHNYSNGTCTSCGAADPNCSHSYTSAITTAPTCVATGIRTYTCSKCGDVYTEVIAANGHSYAGVITAPTCTAAGYTTYTCTVCGDSYTGDSVAATGHHYSNGSCTSCGAADPDYVVSGTEYYLVGYINGADYGCEGDWENLGQYKFVNGKLTATFDIASYVFIKTGDNANWYLTEAYSEGPSAVFVKNASEKMRVPGGVEVTFTLTENADGTLTLSYTTAGTSCSHSYTSQVTTAAGCETTGVKTYTCSSCGHSYTETIAATGHNYVNGTCTGCGKTETTVTDTYYLVGYINGADYGCEGDYANMGEYKFVNGKLNVTFAQNSYVFLKTEGNGKWLMAPAYTEATSCTFAEGNSEKMFVPGGVALTFTLTENADGSVTLSYTTATASVIPTIKLNKGSATFEDEVFFSIYSTITDVEDVVFVGLLVSDDDVVDENDTYIMDYDYTVAGSTYVVRSHGIPAKNLGELVYFKVFAKLADGTYAYSRQYQYSPKVYAMDRLANSTDANLKALCVAMLNYGAAAQTYFGYNTGSLANAELTADQKALVSDYNSSMVTGVTAADKAKIGEFANNSGYSSRKPAVSFEGAFSIFYHLTPKYTPTNGLTAYYWTQETYNSVSVLTRANADGTLKVTMDSASGVYTAIYEGIAAKEIDQPVYVAGVYENGGTSYATGIMVYSLGAYCVDRINNGSAEMQPLAKATAVYGYYAKQYFSNLSA